MLPRWRKEIRLLLTPHRVAVRHFATGFRASIAQDQQCELSSGETLGWVAGLEALERLLASSPARGADATVVVSSYFVRYGLVPASDLLVTRDDEMRFARQNFVRIHGETAERWSVRVSPGGGARSGGSLASGIEHDLVDALHALLERHGLRARALQPALMAVFNEARRTLPPQGCRLVALEPGFAVTALLAPGWRRVRSRRLAGPGEIMRVLERDRVLEEGEAQGLPTCVLPLLPLGFPILRPGEELREFPPYWDDESTDTARGEPAANASEREAA